jgi:hypothetical protein
VSPAEVVAAVDELTSSAAERVRDAEPTAAAR